HGHGGIDPHAWLSPDNAILWLGAIADALAAADPDHADRYRANAAQGRAEIAALAGRIGGELAPLAGRGYIVYHDAYQYFERRFGLTPAGAIALSDASDPGPARLAALRDLVAARAIGCVLVEPQIRPGLLAALAGGTPLREGRIDPLGAGLEPGPALYPQLLEGLARALRSCL
ncbi:metal ABC transporter solute-binding protein, Zn/Mn family, partial [Albidovulum sp.]